MVVQHEDTIQMGHTLVESMETTHGGIPLCICQICTCGHHKCPHTESRMVDHVSSELRQFGAYEYETEQHISTMENEAQFIEYQQHQLQQDLQFDRSKMKRDQTALMLESETTLGGSSYREEFHEKEFEQQKKFKLKQGYEDAREGEIFHSRRMVRERSSSGQRQPEKDDWSVHLHESRVALDSCTHSQSQQQQQLRQSASTERYTSSKSLSAQHEESPSFQERLQLELDQLESRISSVSQSQFETVTTCMQQQQQESLLTTSEQILKGRDSSVSADRELSASLLSDEITKSLLREASTLPVLNTQSLSRKQLRGSKLVDIPFPLECEDRSQETRKTLRKGILVDEHELHIHTSDFDTPTSASAAQSEFSSLLKEQSGSSKYGYGFGQGIEQSETIIQESSRLLKELGEQKETLSQLNAEYSTKSDAMQSSLLEKQSKIRIDNFEAKSSSNMEKQKFMTSTEASLDELISYRPGTPVRTSARDQRGILGSKIETKSDGVCHEFGNIQGLAVATPSKSSMEKIHDQKKAQADQKKVLQSQKVIDADFESSFSRSRSKEHEISSRIAGFASARIENAEKVLRTITDIKSTQAAAADIMSDDSIEIYEKIRTPTASTRPREPLVKWQRKDQQKLEGEVDYESTNRKDFYEKQHEHDKVKAVRRNTYTKQEGEMYLQTTSRDDFTGGKGERVDVKRHADNLHMAGTFYGKEKQPAPKIDRTKPITRADNLKPFEGAFSSRRIEDAPKLMGERAVVKVPKENLRPEGQHYYPPKQTAPVYGERYPVVRHPDNITFQGDFPQRYLQPAPKIDRRKPITRQDNLKPFKGAFTARKIDDAPKFERVVVKIPKENLKPEGQHYYTAKPTAPARGERYPVVRHPDNIVLTGDFPQRSVNVEPAPKFERARPITHGDNLKPEGQHYYPERPIAPGHGERYPVVRHPDNIVLEGNFPKRHVEAAAPRMERAKPVTHGDNLRPEGQHYYPAKPASPVRGERYPVVRHPDNLVPGGEFAKRPVQNGPKFGERFPIKKHEDNLALEGEFAKRVLEQGYKVGDRYPIVKHKDNLTPGGQFYVPPQYQAPRIEFERAKPITQADNVKLFEGAFAFPTRRVEEAPKGERAPVKIATETLKLEGQHYYPEKPTAPAYGDRYPVVRHPDNIILEGDLPRREPTPTPKLSKVKPIMHGDNLKPEGEHFYPQKPDPPKIGGNAYPVKRPVDNLVLEGEFLPRPQEETPKVGERHPIKKPKDNLKPLDGPMPSREMAEVRQGERAEIVVHEDSIRLEGAHSFGKKAEPFVVGEMPKKVVHEDNLSTMTLEGKFSDATTAKENYKTYTAERADVVRHEDNLKMEGELDILEKTDIVLKGDRAAIVKHEDNLTVGEGSMQMETTSRADQRAALLHSIESRSAKQSSRQTSSQIVLGDEAGDAHFDRSVTARRTTIETRNLPNGHMLQERSTESSTGHKAEVKTNADSSVEQKILTQSMSARTGVNESILLNAHANHAHEEEEQEQSLKAVADQSTFEGSLRSGADKTHQIQGHKTGTREVDVTREVTVTKRSGEDFRAPLTRALQEHSETSKESMERSSSAQKMHSSSSAQHSHSSSSSQQFKQQQQQASFRSQQRQEMADSSLQSSSSKALTNGLSESKAIACILDKASDFSRAIEQKSFSNSTSMAESSRKIVSDSSSSNFHEQSTSNIQSSGGGRSSCQLGSQQKSSGISEASSSSYHAQAGGSSSASSSRIVATISQKTSGVGFVGNQMSTASASPGDKQEFVQSQSQPCPVSLLESGKSPFLAFGMGDF